jgi:hypothetical protein
LPPARVLMAEARGAGMRKGGGTAPSALADIKATRSAAQCDYHAEVAVCFQVDKQSRLICQGWAQAAILLLLLLLLLLLARAGPRRLYSLHCESIQAAGSGRLLRASGGWLLVVRGPGQGPWLQFMAARAGSCAVILH